MQVWEVSATNQKGGRVMCYRLKKALDFLGAVIVIVFFLELFFLPVTSYSEEIIANRTGSIRVTQPDGTVSVVGKYEPSGPIPPGSTIEVLEGNIDVAPTTGFIQIVVGDSIATVEVGDTITASVDPRTKMAGFKVNTDEVSVIIGNTTTTLRANQEVQVGLEKNTGAVKVRSINGNIETVTAGVQATIMHGGFAQMRVDSQTRQVHIDSIAGMVEIISLEGKRFLLARGESKDIQGSMLGEVLSFPGEAVEVPALPTEEPAEPEVPEASPYRP